jgi:hypothetical protein
VIDWLQLFKSWDFRFSRWRLEASGMERRVVTLKWTGVSELCTASIIRTPWCYRQYAPLKRRSTSMWLPGATSKKNLNFLLKFNKINNTYFLIPALSSLASFLTARYERLCLYDTMFSLRYYFDCRHLGCDTCSLIHDYQRFLWIDLLHLRGRKWKLYAPTKSR